MCPRMVDGILTRVSMRQALSGVHVKFVMQRWFNMRIYQYTRHGGTTDEINNVIIIIVVSFQTTPSVQCTCIHVAVPQ